MKYILISLLIPFNLYAADIENNYTVRGVGQMECKEFSKMDKNSDKFLVVSNWILGAATTVSLLIQTKTDFFENMDSKTIVAGVYGWCKENPKELVADSFQMLVTANAEYLSLKK